jgi:antitoxin (DNA-binding transcriptional repressor) of toxin-antitoxin stability system
MIVAGRVWTSTCPYHGNVREIEVRDLAAQLNSVLREIEAGERVKVVEDGRPVAEFAPAESPEEQWQRMIDEGRITPAPRPLPKNAPPPIETGTSASELILAEREDER